MPETTDPPRDVFDLWSWEPPDVPELPRWTRRAPRGMRIVEVGARRAPDGRVAYVQACRDERGVLQFRVVVKPAAREEAEPC